MKNILLTLSYDGTSYHGFQRQGSNNLLSTSKKRTLPTIQEEVETALFKTFQKKVTLYGAGRTDSGVHAIGQAASFLSPIDSIPPSSYKIILNNFLPSSIRILQSIEVPPSFNARRSATYRKYRYYIYTSDSPNAIDARYMWCIKERFHTYTPNIDNLNSMAHSLIGEHNFTSLCSKKDASVSPYRYVYDAHFFYTQGLFNNSILVFEITANAFLYNMVRITIGTLLTLDKNKEGIKELIDIISKEDRKRSFITAPPQGLFLYEVSFTGKRVHV